MHRIEFRSVQTETGNDVVVDAVVPFIDGDSLIDVVRPVESPSARRDGQSDLAGRYAGLNDGRVRWPSRHYLGTPVLTWFGDGDTVLLGCPCGDWGCWPFTARVAVGAATVTWSGFRTGHRDWDYRTLGELTFDRPEYDWAVQATAR